MFCWLEILQADSSKWAYHKYVYYCTDIDAGQASTQDPTTRLFQMVKEKDYDDDEEENLDDEDDDHGLPSIDNSTERERVRSTLISTSIFCYHGDLIAELQSKGLSAQINRKQRYQESVDQVYRITFQR